MSAEEFAATTHVSRETLDRLRRFAQLLVKWQGAINLVAADSLDDLWRRHMLDSAQLRPFLPDPTWTLADIGSGAGFPGLVLAIMGVPGVHLIESDSRKCIFLAEAARQTGLDPMRDLAIHNVRVENLRDLVVDAVTSRACAKLDLLLEYAVPLLKPAGACVFLKGAKAAEELTEAQESWHMHVERFASLSSPSGVVIRISHPKRAR